MFSHSFCFSIAKVINDLLTQQKHTVKLLTKNVRLIDSFTPLREDFLKK